LNQRDLKAPKACLRALWRGKPKAGRIPVQGSQLAGRHREPDNMASGPEVILKMNDMSYKNMIAEFEQSLDGCERALRDSSRKLRFLSEVDSSYLGHRYSARIRELNEKLAEVEVEKGEL
jgi:hypothetical protein